MDEEDSVLPTQPPDYVMRYAIVRETLPHAASDHNRGPIMGRRRCADTRVPSRT